MKERNISYFKKTLVVLMAMIMVFTYMPGMAWADEVDAGNAEAESGIDMQADPNAELISVTLEGHQAYFDSMKLYKWDGTQRQGEDLLGTVTKENTEQNYNRYSLSLESGEYFVEGYFADTAEYLGGLVINVAEGSSDFRFFGVTGIKAGNSGWVLGTDYTMEVKVLAQDSSEKKMELGEVTQWGNKSKSCIVLKGDTATATFTPDAEKHPDFMPATVSKTVTQGESLSASCQQCVLMTFTAPEGSTISVGTLSSYYVYTFATPESEKTENGTYSATYKVAKGTNCFYRVQNPSGVTYWNYVDCKQSDTIAVSADDLYIGSKEFKKDTIFHFEKNVYDRADIYLNINQAGYMNMSTGDTYELNSFRNWSAIEGFMNKKIALPDMHYEVVGLDGKESNVVTITPDAKNNNVANMKANKKGAAIVMITYDAMTHMQGQSAAATSGGDATKQFSAIWPECTGVFVVSVDEDGTAIKTNMQLERLDTAASTLDAEHDILFYTGTKGAEYSFTPEAGCTVSVARSTVTDKMSFNGFTTDGVTTDAETGAVTVSKLTTGRHIIKVKKNGVATYQVITARGVSYKMLDADGKEVVDGTKLKPGQKVKLQFSNLVNPQEKFSGAYNFNASLLYEGNDGTTFKSNPGGVFGIYDFSGNPARQLIEITIPKYWAGDTYTLVGNIKMAGNAGVPTHRTVTYAKGTQPGFNAPAASSVLSKLPEVKFSIEKTDFIEGKLNFKDNEGNAVDRKNLTISMSDTDKNPTMVADDGTFACYVGEYNYTINAQGYEYTSGTVTVSDKETSFDIVLNKTSENAWDGLTTTEPSKDADGTYLISSGAEFAWFATNANKANSGIKAKLIADIDLGKYTWTAGSFNKGQCEFDGNGHRVYNLVSSKGLFDTIDKGSVVKNLTVEGAITASNGAAGGIAGYLQNGTIENCINKATIIGAKSKTNIGGIAGYSFNNSTIKNCINKGNISGEGAQVGGILGGTIGGNMSIEDCINEGTVSGNSEVGGIVGSDTNGIAVKDCYNTGEISGETNVGGIAGKSKRTEFTNCYNAGSVNEEKGSGFAGRAEGASFEKCYYLKGTGYDENAQELSGEELKSAELGDGFKLVCKNYPALTWEADKTEHTGQLQKTVAPACGAKGYDLYKCSNCGETYKKNYVAALAHTPDASKETVFPAYKQEVCSVCNAKYKIWNDDRLQYIVLPSKGLESITMSDDATKYPWQWNVRKARFESTNIGQNNTTSESSMTFTLSQACYLSFGYGASSENKCDMVSIILQKDGEETETKIADGISGTGTGKYSEKLESGTYTLRMKYVKDAWAGENEDLGYLTNVKLTEKAESAPVNPYTPDAKPSVTFRLIGAEKTPKGVDVDLGVSKYLPNYVTWIATTTYTLEELGEDATVGTVFKKALDAKGLKYEGYDDNYVSSITSPSGYVLAEMTNGPKSGWMYTVNGSHPDKGLLEYKVKDGEAIIWHYVNDYAYEVQDWFESKDYPALGDASTWNGWLKAVDRVGASGGGAAAAPVEDVKDVTSDTKAGTTTSPTEVTITEKTTADGTKEKVAEVKVSAENQKEILKQAKANKSKEIILNVSKDAVKDATKADVTLDKSFIDSIVKDTDAKLTIKTPFGDKTYTQDELKAMSEAAVAQTITVAIEKAEEPADDAANIAKAKSIVKDMKLVARSSKTAKKNVKAVLRSDAKVKASIKELKDLGFAVKYRFYRSTKKSASYKSAITKKVASYTNTSGKKGTKYFYKVQVRVYDENGKLIAKTALKQCKYAARTWSK